MNVMDDLKMYVNRVNRNYALRDRKMDVNLDANRVNRNYALRDRKTDENSDGSLYLRMSDRLDDLNLADDRHDVLVGRRMNVMDDRNDLKMVLKKCHRVDLPIDPECYAMNRHVMLTVYLSKSCDRMSHDHLRCDRQMMRHRDTNRMDGMNLDVKNPDGKMKNSGAMNSDARMT
jgi:hypothetical protein